MDTGLELSLNLKEGVKMLGPLNTANHPLSECTANEITNYIIENLRPGEKLPNEAELCQVLCVSRTTVREAIKILASRNIVTIVRGVGTYVSEKPGISDDPLGFKFVQDKNRLALELLELRSFIEPPLTKLAAENASDEEINKLERLEQQIEQFFNDGDDFSQLDVEFHTRIAKCSHNHVVGLIIPIFVQEISSETLPSDENHLLKMFEKYRELISSLRKRDGQLASEIMLNLLEQNRNYILSSTQK